ncbi:MAG: phosphopantetheine-binding protein, partial [Myxococcota bacterium]
MGESLSKQLVAWVVCRDSADGEASGDIVDHLLEFLAARLPGYMIPTRIETIAALPLNRNGKLDRRQLVSLAMERQAGAGAASSGQALSLTPLQAQIAAIWRDVLDVDHLAFDDDFFRLGGHSLRATRIIGRLRQALRQDIALRLIFEHSRFDDFCRAIAASQGDGGDEITIITRRKREQLP